MNGQHLRAFVWLRWRLRYNQLRKGGTLNAIFAAIVAVVIAVLAVVLFFVFLAVGWFAFDGPSVSPAILMYVWDGMIVAFLFWWAIGLLTDLQRSEVLSLDKFLHLPVSLTSAFLINYLSTVLSVTLVLVMPAMVGFCLGLVASKGPLLLALLPLLAGFLFMVTAVTYHFQGWLASLMVNKRRRRTIIVLVTGGFILLCQLPNLLVNVVRPWDQKQQDHSATQLNQEVEELKRQKAALTVEEYQKRFGEIHAVNHEQEAAKSKELRERIEEGARWINIVVPPGWLALGAMEAAEGNLLPAALGMLGFVAIGGASLRQSYRTTLRLYQGQFSSSPPEAAALTPAASVVREKTGPTGTLLLERTLPWVSEQATAIAMSGLRSLLRAPEAKMLLLTPAILILVFGSILFANNVEPPSAAVPLMAFAGMLMILLTMVQFLGNLFGFDRGGFRVFVLCPAARRDILLGKNLAFAPVALGLAAPLIVLLQVAFPMRFDRFLSLVPQYASMYLLYCLVGNAMSIFVPMAVAGGTLKPTNVKIIPVLLQMVVLSMLPALFVPTLLPIYAEIGMEWLGWVEGWPIGLALSLAMLAGVVAIYLPVVAWEGSLLQDRERAILESVTTKEE